MHELSIAENILSIVERYVPESERRLVRTVKVSVGAQAGIVPDSLQFSFEAIISESTLAGATLTIETVPFTIRCRSCGRGSTPEDGTLTCSQCGSMDTEVTGGTEMRVIEVELDDMPEEGQ